MREMDAAVAREVFGNTTWRAEKPEYVAGRDWIDPGDYFYYPDGTSAQAHRLPDYSTDISAAWLVIEALAQSPHWIGVIVGTFGIPHAKCYRDSKLVSEEWIDLDDIPDTRSLSERCAHAICLAALKALSS